VKLFALPASRTRKITQRDMDLSYAMQHCFEEVFFHLLNELHGRVPEENLAMAGGCALNSVATESCFEDSFPPHLDSTRCGR